MEKNFDLSRLLQRQTSFTFKEKWNFVWKLSLPGIFAQISSILMQYIDAAMVGNLGALQSAAIGLVASSTWIIGGLISSISSGFAVQISQAVGEGNKKNTKIIFNQSLIVCILFSILIASLAGAISFKIPVWLGAEQEICKDASMYFLIFSLSTPFFQIVYLFSSSLQATGSMKIVGILNILMCVLDVIFNYLFIYILNLGVTGAALGTCASAATCAALFLYFGIIKNEYLGVKNHIKTSLKSAEPRLAQENLAKISEASLSTEKSAEISGATLNARNLAEISGAALNAENLAEISEASLNAENPAEISEASLNARNLAEISEASLNARNLAEISEASLNAEKSAIISENFATKTEKSANQLQSEIKKIKFSCTKKAFKLAIPIAIEKVAFTGALVVVTKIIAPLGPVVIAANSFATTAEALCYMPGYGFGEASTTLVGQSMGAKRTDLAKSFAWISVLFGVLSMTLMGIIMYFACPFIFKFLTSDQAIRELSTKVLRIELFAEPLYAAAIVAMEALRGAQDTVVPCILNLISIWLVRITLSLILVAPLGLEGIWIAMAIELCVRGILMIIRLLTSKNLRN